MKPDKIYPTPEMCRAAYEFFRTTLPYRRWRLPDAEQVVFKITDSGKIMGSVYYPSGKGQKIRPRMEISERLNFCTDLLIRTIAHEMCHLRQFQLDGWHIVDPDKEYGHGEDFKKLAKLVCRRHGFNPKTF